MNQQVTIATPLNKISVMTVYGKLPTKVIKEDDQEKIRLPEPVAIMRLIGQATEYKVKESNFGPSLEFSGIFRATNLATGELFESAKCFVPNIVESTLGKALDDHDVIDFALEIAAVPAKNAHGYEYRVKPLIPTAPAPIFAQIEAKIGGAPALAHKPEPVAPESGDKPAAKKGK